MGFEKKKESELKKQTKTTNTERRANISTYNETFSSKKIIRFSCNAGSVEFSLSNSPKGIQINNSGWGGSTVTIQDMKDLLTELERLVA